ncbi:family 2 encapsulin nanocompartment cargo protein polyprenyl transferase [Allosalinactinospora lopnorensis]|uniref:family 2 encapsulin nanocompartment cargo protein polyprenyl transferase n=1 Tax=Allosalinactinospora lopnorensis TaxID=1352348 RepID=UPI000623EE0B|nr:family 2 encapsulin nanocompartment cargo protein polyprenyl transferase [Allosalinactinospora lopnorensis]
MSPTGEMTEGRSARDVLTWSRDMVDPALREAVERLPASMRDIAGYHFGWRDEHGRPTEADGGKALRPALALLAAPAVGGTPAAAVPAAVAVELVHNFSLLHDDVMDGDATRRHRPTAWSVFGRGSAILAGDALLTLASDVLAGSGHPTAHDGTRRLSTAVLSLVDGQSLDMAFERRADVDLDECLSMVERKTAALFGCACVLGALFGGASPERGEYLRAFGERVGMAFQFADDLLGIWGDPNSTGKPVYSDLRNRKKSLPVVAALTSGTAAGRELAALYGRDPHEESLSGAELTHAAELIERAGGRAWSRHQIGHLLESALCDLDASAPSEPAALELAALARLVGERGTVPGGTAGPPRPVPPG